MKRFIAVLASVIPCFEATWATENKNLNQGAYSEMAGRYLIRLSLANTQASNEHVR